MEARVQRALGVDRSGSCVLQYLINLNLRSKSIPKVVTRELILAACCYI
jgi:hypothetical protein